MSEDRSITDFSASEPGETNSSDDEADTVEQAAITYRSRPDGFVCAVCGAKTTSQWVDDGEFVCPDCKSWA